MSIKMFLALELTDFERGIACFNMTGNDLDVDVILSQSKKKRRRREIEADAMNAFLCCYFL